MKPKSVKLDGAEIRDVTNVWVEFNNPAERGGYRTAHTPHPAKIYIARRATQNPSDKLFELTTNSDGSKKLFDGTLVLQDDARRTTYTFDIQNAFVEGWSLSMHEQNAEGEEKIALCVREFTVHVGAESGKFDGMRSA
jgi:hypothetical protein